MAFSELMECIPYVIQQHMMPYLVDPDDVKSFSNASKAAHAVAEPRLKSDREAMIEYVVAWSYKNATATNDNQTSACLTAAEQGETEVLRWLRSQGYAWAYRACCTAAAGNGHIMTLIWLRDCAMAQPCLNSVWVAEHDTAICDAAERGGHEAAFEWARGVGCAWFGVYDSTLNTFLQRGDIVSYCNINMPEPREALVLGVDRRTKRLLLIFPNCGGGGHYPMMDGGMIKSQIRYRRHAGSPITLDVFRDVEIKARCAQLQKTLGRPLSNYEKQNIKNGIHRGLFTPSLDMLGNEKMMENWGGGFSDF